MPTAISPPTSTDQREAVLLADYAFHSRDSGGRKYPEPSHGYRGPYQRDRDRILHSAAFRRLSGKMQVFTGEHGDYHRTRLTHTHEVASIARTLGRAMRLNEDLIEALALFHDIGHPPYGHAGEDILNKCLRDVGGFSHNRYALTLAQDLEERYADFPGLNLSQEVLQGQANRVDKQSRPVPILEVQVVDLADSITYDAHDTDDALKLGLVQLADLRPLPLIRSLLDRVDLLHGDMSGKIRRKALIHELIDFQVSDVLTFNLPRLQQVAFGAAREVQQADFRLSVSPLLAEHKSELERFLYRRVYRHEQLIAIREQAQRRLRQLFECYCRDSDQMSPRFLRRRAQVGVPQSVGEYLAGMTDRYCEQRCAELGLD